MPNGGRQGDNPQSWFMDALCTGDETYLGEPIDSLACQIYRVSNHEYAAGIHRNDKKDEINPIELEAKLREILANEKEKRRQRINLWVNTDASGKQFRAPKHIVEPIKDTVRYALNYCSDCIERDGSDAREVDPLMEVIDQVRKHFSSTLANWGDTDHEIAKRMFSVFDKQNWKGAPHFVEYLESAIGRAN